ncbi:ATP-binding protein [Paenibacillus eucommiae]|uniref:histidine kinase n=1 Tax=Paenibacillus eucommiae TaxID=1355755 RepID=A0ABS4J8U3_9BACL|nr:ATP-binding protein [Paenibacillus eucommiae]MBP1995686.1 two-component system sporulation sensor kinase B [Paenibacillus eucommiae]
MEAIDDLLLNVLVLTAPILLYYILWLDKPKPMIVDFNKRWNALMCSLGAIFCMTHPFFSMTGAMYDLRLIPLLVAFLYGGIAPGLLVSASIIAYAYYLNAPDFMWTVANTILPIPFFLGFIALSHWEQKSTKVMFPSLLALLSALTSFCISLLYRITNEIPLHLSFFLMGVLYCMFHFLTMLLLTYLIERIKENLWIRQEVQHSEKLNVLSELAASVAHEIRNPMTVARGFMQLLNQSQVSEEKRTMYTTMVIEEIDRAQSIISDYLSLAKPQAEKLENVNISLLMVKLMNLISPYASLRNVQIELHTAPSLNMEANADKLIQCLVNLTKNGIEAMPVGGTLDIIGYKEHTKIILEIKDNGIGMSQEQIERLGTPFYSTKLKGTGLGMMVSYNIIKSFNGSIHVQSELGKGTCMRVSFPSLPESKSSME